MVGETWIRGTVLSGHEEVRGEELDEMFSSPPSLSDITERIRDLNGQYAIVHITDDDAYAIVDRVRSMPLFYATVDKGAYVSDDPYWIQDQVGDRSIDERNKAEFLMTGYVTDDRTLSPYIKQVRSGESVHLHHDPQGKVAMEREYYQFFVPSDFFANDLDQGLKELDSVMTDCFQRLIEHSGGRTLVVPLSGGYDSRLIILMLKRLGVGNVITFSYGRRGSAETEIAKKLSQQLGYPWLFFEYTNEKWRELKKIEDYDKYALLSSSLVSSPHMQEFPAVMKMKREGMVPSDSVFVPGHTVALHDVPEMTGNPDDLEPVVDDIYDHHYNLDGRPSHDPQVEKWCKENIAKCLGDMSKFVDRYSAYDCWNYVNRQSKFTVNAVRVYDYWGYDWWMPLEDKRFWDLWSHVPNELRSEKRLVREYVDRLSGELLDGVGVPHYQTRLHNKEIKRMAEAIAKNKRLSKLLGYPFYYYRKKTIYNSHPQAYYGMVSWKRFKSEYNGRQTVNYFLATDFLDSLMRYLDRQDKSSR